MRDPSVVQYQVFIVYKQLHIATAASCILSLHVLLKYSSHLMLV